METMDRAMMEAAYGQLPAPLLLAERDQAGVWRSVYENPAAESLPDRSRILAALSRELDAAYDGTLQDRCSVELDGRQLSMRLARQQGELVAVLIRDQTWELLRYQEQLQAASAALQSALDAANAASQAKSDFLSHMSHDIRTPLNAIIGMTTIAQAHMQEPSRLADCLEKIGLSSHHLLGLINDILDMSRIESGKMTLNPEEFTMADFLHGLMAVFQPQADKKHQKVTLDFAGIRCEHVRGDQLRIQQVLVNILGNAVKFTPEEGEILLRVRETGQHYGSGAYAYYEFTVRDTGMGMSPEFLARIFQPFERADSAHRIEGTGLGMTITHNLVEMMNGTISVSSKEGSGSQFTVTIPLEQLDRPETGAEELRGLRILAADEPAPLAHLRDIAGELGIELDGCSSNSAALDMAVQAHMEGRDYFAILLAWRLPVVDGVKACRELRAMLGGAVPIVLTSSYEWTLSDDEMRKYGITAFVSKPMFRSRLVQTLLSFTEAGAKRAQSEADDTPDFSGRHILLAEDNEINREIAVELIEMFGAEVECAEDGRQALEMFSSSEPGHYDLIFMDLQMPVMDGLTAAQAIRDLPRTDSGTVPIVAMTANAFVEDIRACHQAGMDAHLAKPISLQQLTDVLRQQLG